MCSFTPLCLLFELLSECLYSLFCTWPYLFEWRPSPTWIDIGKMKPRHHEIYVILMSQRWSGRNHETMNSRNHETYRHFDVQEMKCTKPLKPRNHETMKPIVISMSQRLSARNHETCISFLLSTDGDKSWNHETMSTGFLVSWSARRDKPRNHEAMKPQVSFSKMCPDLSS